jgi:hypothetical protein
VFVVRLAGSSSGIIVLACKVRGGNGNEKETGRRPTRCPPLRSQALWPTCSAPQVELSLSYMRSTGSSTRPTTGELAAREKRDQLEG